MVNDESRQHAVYDAHNFKVVDLLCGALERVRAHHVFPTNVVVPLSSDHKSSAHTPHSVSTTYFTDTDRHTRK